MNNVNQLLKISCYMQLTTVTNLIIKFSFYYTLILLIKYSFLR